jgi:CRP/FNR family transcriptional regulator, nitrogen fixation regulation protein
VIEGAVRSHKLLSDGRRQIGAFHLAGDIFGLEHDFHRFTAEAIVDTTVRLTKREIWSAWRKPISRSSEAS